MEYPFVTVTDAGADLLASTNGDPNNSLVIDKAVFSNQKSNTNKPLEQLTPSDFANPLVYQITTVKHHQNTIQPEVTLDNKNFKQNYPIYMIGILAHAENDNSGNETLYAVEEASNDPMIMPKATDNDFNCTFGIPIGISRSQDVNIVTTEAGTVSDKDFKEYKDSMNSQLASSVANQVADSSSLTNLSQSASYNSSNISTINNQLSNVANNTSVSTAISNVSNVAAINSTNINSLTSAVSNNSDKIDDTEKFANNKINLITKSLQSGSSNSQFASDISSLFSSASANSNGINDNESYTRNETNDLKNEISANATESASNNSLISSNVSTNSSNIASINNQLPNMFRMYKNDGTLDLSHLPTDNKDGIYDGNAVKLHNLPKDVSGDYNVTLTLFNDGEEAFLIDFNNFKVYAIDYNVIDNYMDEGFRVIKVFDLNEYNNLKQQSSNMTNQVSQLSSFIPHYDADVVNAIKNNANDSLISTVPEGCYIMNANIQINNSSRLTLDFSGDTNPIMIYQYPNVSGNDSSTFYGMKIIDIDSQTIYYNYNAQGWYKIKGDKVANS